MLNVTLRKQKYSYILGTERNYAKSAIHFEKIYLAREALDFYDVIVSLDVEVFVANQTKRVEEFLEPNQEVYLSQRFTNPEIMSGAFIVKSSQWTKNWMDRWLDFDRTEKPNQNYDNGALIMLLAETLLRNESSELKELENIYASGSYHKNSLEIMKIIWNLDPAQASQDAFRIQIFTAFQSFVTVDPDSSDDLDFPNCQNLPETRDFWCKLLGNELFVHSKHGFKHFVSNSVSCDVNYKGPVYDNRMVLESKSEIVELMKISSILNSIRGGIYFTEHIAFCWPNCKPFWNGDDCYTGANSH